MGSNIHTAAFVAIAHLLGCRLRPAQARPRNVLVGRDDDHGGFFVLGFVTRHQLHGPHPGGSLSPFLK